MSVAKNKEEAKGILEHIAELRTRIFVSLGAVILGSIAAHFYYQEIISFILRPSGQQSLIFLSPLEPLFFILKLDLLVGLALAFPVISWCVLSYLNPVFSRRAWLITLFAYSASLALLVAGLAYTYFVTFPLSLRFLLAITIPGVDNAITAKSYLGFFFTQAAIISLIFQIPVLILAGLRLGAFSVSGLSAKRRYVYLFGLIALSVITPTTDLFNLAIVLAPTVLIFEISLLAGRLMEWLSA